MKSRIVAYAIAALAIAACRSSGDDSGSPDSSVNPPKDSSVSNGDSAVGTPTTVAMIRQNNPVNNSMVTLNTAVVVGRVSSTSYGHIWVQDPGGGMYSGIHLFCDFRTAGKCPMNRAMVDAINVGQVVSVVGKWNVFTPTAPAGAQPQIEIQAPMATPTGANMTPVAFAASVSDIAKGNVTNPASKALWGVYVQVPGPFTVPNVAPSYQSLACSTDGGTASTATAFEALSGGMTAVVQLRFYKTLMTRCLPQCPGFTCATPITTANTFSSITGVLEPDYDTGSGMVFLGISPVTDADLPN